MGNQQVSCNQIIYVLIKSQVSSSRTLIPFRDLHECVFFLSHVFRDSGWLLMISFKILRRKMLRC